MEPGDDAKEKAEDAGERLDEAIENVGYAIEEKVGPPAEKLADKVADATGGSPDEGGS